MFINEKGGVIREPTDVREYTDRYQMESDVYLEFIRENLRDSTDPRARITKEAAWDHFRFWCRNNAQWYKPNKHELHKQLILRLGEPKRGWVGKRLIAPRQEEDDDDVEEPLKA